MVYINRYVDDELERYLEVIGAGAEDYKDGYRDRVRKIP